MWGRTRLPLKEMDCITRHIIQLDKSKSDKHFPVGKTCYFLLNLPIFKTEDTLREKLLYAQTNCMEINADYTRAPNEEEPEESGDRPEERLEPAEVLRRRPSFDEDSERHIEQEHDSYGDQSAMEEEEEPKTDCSYL